MVLKDKEKSEALISTFTLVFTGKISHQESQGF